MADDTGTDQHMKRGATLSLDGMYRYRLTRRWGDDDGATVTWVMLNPSTADGTTDDPTIRRCVGFARSWGFDAMHVVNLFAFRATDPKALHTADDAVGPLNHRHVRLAIDMSAAVVCAWGANARKVPQFRHAPNVRDIAGRTPIYCLGTTKDGSPRHPLYVKADTQLVRFWPEEVR